MKICSKCKIEQLEVEFYEDKRTTSKLQSQCRKCIIKYQQKYYINNKENIRTYRKNLRKKNSDIILQRSKNYYNNNKISIRNKIRNKKYNISQEQYNNLLKSQNFLCKICKEPEKRLSSNKKDIKQLAVDHCHKTQKIRGLLCSNCNPMLGYAKDSLDILKEAIKYLEENI